MEIIAVRIDTCLVNVVSLINLFHKKLTAFGAVLIDGFEVADKVTLGIIGTAVEFLAPAFCFSGNNISGTFGAFGQGY